MMLQLRPVGVAKLLELGIPAEAGEDADAEPVEQRQHAPEIPGDVVLADQVDIVVRSIASSTGGSAVPITYLNRISPASRLPMFLSPMKPGVFTGITGMATLSSPPCRPPRCRRRSWR